MDFGLWQGFVVDPDVGLPFVYASSEVKYIHGRFEDGPLARVGEGDDTREGNTPSPPAPLPQAGEGRFEDGPLARVGNTARFVCSVPAAVL